MQKIFLNYPQKNFKPISHKFNFWLLFSPLSSLNFSQTWLLYVLLAAWKFSRVCRQKGKNSFWWRRKKCFSSYLHFFSVERHTHFNGGQEWMICLSPWNRTRWNSSLNIFLFCSVAKSSFHIQSFFFSLSSRICHIHLIFNIMRRICKVYCKNCSHISRSDERNEKKIYACICE